MLHKQIEGFLVFRAPGEREHAAIDSFERERRADRAVLDRSFYLLPPFDVTEHLDHGLAMSAIFTFLELDKEVNTEQHLLSEKKNFPVDFSDEMFAGRHVYQANPIGCLPIELFFRRHCGLLSSFWHNRITLLYNGNIMSKQQILMILGIWIAIILFLGFPSGWDKAFALISGLLVAGIAWSMRSPRTARPSASVPFVEHKAAPQETRAVDGITNSTTL